MEGESNIKDGGWNWDVFSSHMEYQCCGNILESLKVILSLITRQGSHWWDWVVSVELLVDVAFWRFPNNKTLMLGQKIAHLKLTTGTHCPEQHPHSSLNIQKSGDASMKPFPHVLVALVQEGSMWVHKQICGHKPRHKTFGLQSSLLKRCAEAIELRGVINQCMI